MTPSGAEAFLESVGGYWRAGGWLMCPLAITTYMIMYRSLVMLRALREAVATRDGYYGALAERVRSGVSRRDCYEWLLAQSGAVPRVAWHVLLRTAKGMPLRVAFRQCRDAEISRHTRGMAMLAVLVAVAPLLGLLGTVLGMVGTFQAVGVRHADTAVMVADGIGQALVTTQIGLVAALPGTFALAYLQRLLRRLANDIDRCESYLVVSGAEKWSSRCGEAI